MNPNEAIEFLERHFENDRALRLELLIKLAKEALINDYKTIIKENTVTISDEQISEAMKDAMRGKSVAPEKEVMNDVTEWLANSLSEEDREKLMMVQHSKDMLRILKKGPSKKNRDKDLTLLAHVDTMLSSVLGEKMVYNDRINEGICEAIEVLRNELS